MKSLLVVAHGSRRHESNDEVREIVRQLHVLDTHYERIECAFLELAEPSIPDGLRRMIEAGSDDVVVLPYFLSAGRHVTDDVPNEVDTVCKEYPSVTIHLAPYLGSSPAIANLLLSQAGLPSVAMHP